jgi:hypothetical protein
VLSLNKLILSILASTGKKHSVADLMKIRSIARRHPKARTISKTLERFSKPQNGDPPFLCRVTKDHAVLYFCEDQARLEAYIQGRSHLSWLPRAYKGMTVGGLPIPTETVHLPLPATRIDHREVAYFRLTKSEFNAVKRRYKASPRKRSTPVYKVRGNFFRMVVYEPNADVSFYSEGPTGAWKPEIEALFGLDLANDLENAYAGRLESIMRPIRLEKGQAIDRSQLPYKVTGKVYINHATGRQTLVRNGTSQLKDEVDLHGPAGPTEMADREWLIDSLQGNVVVNVLNALIGLQTGIDKIGQGVGRLETNMESQRQALQKIADNTTVMAESQKAITDLLTKTLGTAKPPEEKFEPTKPETSDFWYG